jgi:hypothetical protein
LRGPQRGYGQGRPGQACLLRSGEGTQQEMLEIEISPADSGDLSDLDEESVDMFIVIMPQLVENWLKNDPELVNVFKKVDISKSHQTSEIFTKMPDLLKEQLVRYIPGPNSKASEIYGVLSCWHPLSFPLVQRALPAIVGATCKPENSPAIAAVRLQEICKEVFSSSRCTGAVNSIGIAEMQVLAPSYVIMAALLVLCQAKERALAIWAEFTQLQSLSSKTLCAYTFVLMEVFTNLLENTSESILDAVKKALDGETGTHAMSASDAITCARAVLSSLASKNFAPKEVAGAAFQIGNHAATASCQQVIYGVAAAVNTACAPQLGSSGSELGLVVKSLLIGTGKNNSPDSLGPVRMEAMRMTAGLLAYICQNWVSVLAVQLHFCTFVLCRYILMYSHVKIHVVGLTRTFLCRTRAPGSLLSSICLCQHQAQAKGHNHFLVVIRQLPCLLELGADFGKVGQT